MATLGDLRQRVYYFVDDDGTSTTDGTRWSNAEVDDALEVALDEVVAQYADNGGNALDEVLETAMTAGSLDLSSYKPVKIKSVEIKTGDTYVNLRAVRNADASVAQTGLTNTLRVTYIARPSLPDGYSGTFTYGASGAPFPSFNQLVCVKAAQYLLIKDGEINSALEQSEQKLWQSVMSANRVPRVFAMGYAQGVAGALYPPGYAYSWRYKPHQIDLFLGPA